MTFEERRKYPRFEGQFPVDLLNMGDDPSISLWESVVPGTALDVSKEGMRLQCPYNVDPGCFLSIIFYYKGRGSVCICETVWKKDLPNSYLYGLFIREWSQIDNSLAQTLTSLEKAKKEEVL